MIGYYTKLHDNRWGLFEICDDYSFRERMGHGLYRRVQVCEKLLILDVLYMASYSAKMPEFVEFVPGQSLIPGCQ